MTATVRTAAALASGAGLLVALAFLPRGCAEDTPPPQAGPEVVRNPAYFPNLAAPPPLRIDVVVPDAAASIEAPVPGEDPAAAPPCEGCLPEPGALDVAETFLYHMRKDYIDTRTELYSDIAARLEAAGLPPPHETLLPKLPPGLVDAPPDFSMSGRVLPSVERPGETWVVWVQLGWLNTQSFIDGGSLPPTAAAWPRLKTERFMLVDARSGEVFRDDIWRGRYRRSLGAYGDVAVQAAAERAEHWFARSPAAPAGIQANPATETP